jgi:SAM-dependent methyltransferase
MPAVKRLKNIRLTSGILSILFNPYYFVKKGIFRGLRDNAHYLQGKLLDFGCGNRSYQTLFPAKEQIGLEIYQKGHDHTGEKIDVYYDGVAVPFRAESFDSVLCIEVLEHVFEPDRVLKELWRVMKTEACLVMTVPFVWEEHEQPYDYGRLTQFGLKYLLQKNGFEVKIYEKRWMVELIRCVNLFIFKTGAGFKILRYLFIPIFILPANILGSVPSVILPGNKDIYLNAVIVAKKVC